jgi:tetratricopeptide (TPR) repeat protein
VSDDPKTQPRLSRFYQSYLRSEDCSAFIRDVAQFYTIDTIHQLALRGDRIVRRAATMAIGFLGDFSSNGVLGECLRDQDRGVRMLSEHGIQRIWFRQGSQSEQLELNVIQRLNRSHEFRRTIRKATKLIRASAQLGEAWNQRGIAYFALGNFKQALNDCRETLNLNPYHFSANVGIGHCLLMLGKPEQALMSFRDALAINPSLDSVREQINHLQRRKRPKS